MNVNFQSIASGQLEAAMKAVCHWIPPTWPLDQIVAVNPWWELKELPMETVAARLECLAGIQCLMPASYYQQCWDDQRITSEHLQTAMAAYHFEGDAEDWLNSLTQTPSGLGYWQHWVDKLDVLTLETMGLRTVMEQQLSDFLGHMVAQKKSTDLYAIWRRMLSKEGHLRHTQFAGMLEQVMQLPPDHASVYHLLYDACERHPNFTDYAFSLLLDIQGWASHFAYHVWQDGLFGHHNDAVEQLLAIRMAWDWLFKQSYPQAAAWHTFIAQFQQGEVWVTEIKNAQLARWIGQRATEFAFQAGLQGQLRHQPSAMPTEAPPKLQAVFCIDVRSEAMRKALEQQHPDIQTFGFAGFFGLPIEYCVSGNAYRWPQLPGLAKPTLQVTQSDEAVSIHSHEHGLCSAAMQASFAKPLANFGLLQVTGLAHVIGLIKNSRPKLPPTQRTGLPKGGEWQIRKADQPLGPDEIARLLAGILKTMGLTDNFAPEIWLVGHGSHSFNNAQASALACGACGGHSGLINVMVLADLLNRPAIRQALQALGVIIPATTQFRAAHHDTVLDEIEWVGDAPPEPLLSWLDQAQFACREQRSGQSKGEQTSEALTKQAHRRAHDWSELKPENGLNNNAAFIIAPRSATRHLDLAGRCFLHDYDFSQDASEEILEKLMTATLIVTNWINLQYYASTVDNRAYGSGDKRLHDIVQNYQGLTVGDEKHWRSGLALQKVYHQGRYLHEPLRLSVYIAAPYEAIAAIVERHGMLKALLHNQWLFLFQWDIQKGVFQRIEGGTQSSIQ